MVEQIKEGIQSDITQSDIIQLNITQSDTATGDAPIVPCAWAKLPELYQIPP